jgi:hypothetical protein
MANRPRRVPNRNPTPETVLGNLVSIREHTYDDFLTNSQYVVGDQSIVPVARVVLCADGAVRYRIFRTIIWVAESEGFLANDDLKALATTGFVEKTQNEFNVYQKHGKHNKTALDVPAVSYNKKRLVQGSDKHMDKNQLRSLFSAVTSATELEITFGGPRAHLSGAYRVVRTRTGRGKGGSRLLDLTRVSDGQTLTTGTPDSNTIVNIVVDGVRHGLDNASDLPVVFGRNKSVSNEFKRVTRSVMERRRSVSDAAATVTVESDLPEFSGTFSVANAIRCRGRGGPCRLDLVETGTGRELTLWSSRHSGAISSITLAPEEA